MSCPRGQEKTVSWLTFFFVSGEQSFSLPLNLFDLIEKNSRFLEIVGGDGKGYMWFNHASNAPLSGAREDGADGVMQVFEGSGKAAGDFTALGNGWDKNSNINIQVFARRVSGAQLAAK